MRKAAAILLASALSLGLGAGGASAQGASPSPRPAGAGDAVLPEKPEESVQAIPPHLTGSALTLDIVFRVTPRKNPEEVWERRSSRDALPGGAIQLRMVSKSLVIQVQLNPLLRSDGTYTLRAGGQVWMSQGTGALKYHASVTSLDVKKGETVVFYPLGPDSDSDLIEVLISLNPYRPKEE